MARYESDIKQIPYAQSSVYAKVSDLNNLTIVKERLNNPEAMAALKASGKVNDEQLKKMHEYVDTLTFSTDEMSLKVDPVGVISVRVVEREPEKCVKYESTVSPVPVTVWLQILPVTATTSKIRLTVDAKVNPFIKMMVDKPLREGVQRVADALAMIPYE